jgi:hypothetical protein
MRDHQIDCAARLRLPSRTIVRQLLILVLATVACANTAAACDVCAIYTATEQRESRAGWRVGVAEQFTRFTTLRENGHTIDNPGEHLNSSITQFVLGYDVNARVGAQLTLPVITRVFRRREHGVITSGNETGIGDVSLLGVVRPFSWVSEDAVVRTSLLGGLELPTGSADRLKEELADAESDGPIGVHGHDLALGSGSVDGIVGGSVFASWKRVFWTTSVQYAMRTEGKFDYRYANDVTWAGGPGLFPYLTHDATVALQAVVSGEHKGLDTQAGQEAEDTGITAVYMGPALSVTWHTTLAADVGADFPLLQDNTAVQIVPDYRVHAGVSWRF